MSMNPLPARLFLDKNSFDNHFSLPCKGIYCACDQPFHNLFSFSGNAVKMASFNNNLFFSIKKVLIYSFSSGNAVNMASRMLLLRDVPQSKYQINMSRSGTTMTNNCCRNWRTLVSSRTRGGHFATTATPRLKASP